MYPEKRIASTRQRLFDYYVTEVAKDEQVRSLRERMAALQKEHKARMVSVRTLGSALRPIYEKPGGRRYVLDDDGEPVYGVWFIPPEECDRPIIVESRPGNTDLEF